MRKPAVDSILGKVEAAKRSQVAWKVPEGLSALNKSEQSVWHQYTSARSDWNDSGLRQLHRLVKMETLAHKIGNEASKTPAVCAGHGGTPKAHPIHAESRAYHASLNSILSLLKLTPGESASVRDIQPAGSTRGKRKLELLA